MSVVEIRYAANAEVSRLRPIEMDFQKPGKERRYIRNILPPIVALFLIMSLATMTSEATPARAASPYGPRAVEIAASKRGAPYAYGATGPKIFDCSGLTLYAFREAGRTLPRTAEQQYESTRHISRSQRTPGDLVFFPSGATMSHVGIYAGDDSIWHAPRPGTRVRLERIWSGDVRYTRAN
ncbi:C40 family peptidase [Streptomyces sp. NPDC002138]|uniref:C40 family peptidase n=1 Tax=Streptomyces sp. NPDC002138 TaxID=3154410 RepID=UPI003332AFFF